MSDKMNKDQESDGVGRRSFLKCMAWAGTGLVWAMNAGVLTSCTLRPGARRKGKFSFVLCGRVELFRLGEISDITGVNQESRLIFQCIDPANGLLESARHILIRLLAKSNMAVTDLASDRPASFGLRALGPACS